jgi:hypothetical protein
VARHRSLHQVRRKLDDGNPVQPVLDNDERAAVRRRVDAVEVDARCRRVVTGERNGVGRLRECAVRSECQPVQDVPVRVGEPRRIAVTTTSLTNVAPGPDASS